MPRPALAQHDVIAMFPRANGESMDVDEQAWPRFLSSVTAQRLTGLACAAVEQGALRLSDHHADELIARQRTAMMQTLGLERRLLDVASAFEANGITYLVLKGPVLANAFYPDPAWRPFIDIDVLVHADHWQHACRVLASIGFRRVLPEPRPGFDDHYGKAALHRDGQGFQLDLHRRLVLGPFGLWMDPERLFAEVDRFQLGPRYLPRLDDTALLLHACIHAALGANPPLAIPSRDVVEIVRAGDIDWDRFVDEMGRWRLSVVVDHCARILRSRFEIVLPDLDDAISRAQVRGSERRALRAYTTERRRSGGLALATLGAIPGIAPKIGYMWDMLMPSRDFLTVRAAGGQPSYLRRWSVPLGWVGRSGRERRLR